MTNLLFKVDATVSADLVCDPNLGGKCLLTKPCSNYSTLWSSGWGFKIQFTGSANYMIVPISALAVDDVSNSVCDVYIQYLN